MKQAGNGSIYWYCAVWSDTDREFYARIGRNRNEKCKNEFKLMSCRSNILGLEIFTP